MDVMEVNIISPDNEIFSGKAHMVVIPGEEGYFAAMLDHAPTVTYLKPGKIIKFALSYDEENFDKEMYFIPCN